MNLYFHDKKIMNKFLYPSIPVRCIVCGPSDGGKSYFLTFLILKNISKF